MALVEARENLFRNQSELDQVMTKLIRFTKELITLQEKLNDDSITPERKKSTKKELKTVKKNIKMYRKQLFNEINDVAECELTLEALQLSQEVMK